MALRDLIADLLEWFCWVGRKTSTQSINARMVHILVIMIMSPIC